MPALRSVVRLVLAVAGVAIVLFGVGVGATAWGTEGFPAGLALGFALLAVAAGGAVLGAAALLSGESFGPLQRAGLQLAGALAVLAFVLPAGAVFLSPDLLFDWFGSSALVAPILAWFSLTLGALLVAVAVGVWRAGELVSARVG